MMYYLPPIEPAPLPPGASTEKKIEYQRSMAIYRSEIRAWKQQSDWGLAVHLVAAAVLCLITLALIVGMIYFFAGVFGLLLAATAGLVFWLSVVEVKRRL